MSESSLFNSAGCTPVATAPAQDDQGSTAADRAYDQITALFEAQYPGLIPPNDVIEHVTRIYLDCLDPADPPSPREVQGDLIALTNLVYAADNEKRKPNNRTPLLRRITPYMNGQCLLRLHHIVRIAPNARDTDREYDLLAMYQPDGPQKGTYTTSEDEIRTVARKYDRGLSAKHDMNEILAVLNEDSRRTGVCMQRDLVAVENGIFNYSTEALDAIVDGRRHRFEPKTLHPFDPAFVFLSKSHVRYVEDPQPVRIVHPVDQTDWEVTEWMHTLSDDPEVVTLLWEILGAIIRPHVRWNKTAWFYSEQGNNGKGTLCALMRNLVGPGAHTSIAVSEFGKDFALEPLVRVSAIIVDENDVGTFIDQAANLKAIVTNDVIQINRKYRMPVAYQFWGFMVQCLNEFPRARDKSESFYRRQLFVPFEKSFTGMERTYIKDDYLNRQDVLEYVLWYVLNQAGAGSPGSYYTLSEPVATKAVLAEYKKTNDPVRGFWEEFRDRLVWDLVPFTFLYELYRGWFAEVSPSGSPVSRQQFVSDLVSIVRNDEEWYCRDKEKKESPRGRMSQPEPLIAEYELKKWMNPNYTSAGADLSKRCLPPLAPQYRGLQRMTATAGI